MGVDELPARTLALWHDGAIEIELLWHLEAVHIYVLNPHTQHVINGLHNLHHQLSKMRHHQSTVLDQVVEYGSGAAAEFEIEVASVVSKDLIQPEPVFKGIEFQCFVDTTGCQAPYIGVKARFIHKILVQRHHLLS